MQVPVNPKSTLDELAGFVLQVEPAAIVTDPELAPTVVAAVRVGAVARPGDPRRARALRRGPRRRRPRTGGARRRRGDDPDVGDDRAVEARHADAPGVRDGGGGLPVLVAPHERRPADDVAAALPHQRARLLDARVARGARQPRAAAVVLGARLPRRRPPHRRHAVQLDRGDARDPHAPARAPRRRRQSDPPLLHGSVAGAGPARGDRAPLRFEITCGYALSESPYGLVWLHDTRPYGTLGSPRQHPELGHVNDARVLEDGRPVGPGGTGELELRNPAIMQGLLRDAGGDGRGGRRRMAAHRRSRRRQRRRHLHVRRPQEGGDPPARARTSRPRRWRPHWSGMPTSPRRRWSACRRTCRRKR